MKELYLNTPTEVHNFLMFVGTYRLFGIIPLDIIAHLTISILLTIIILRMTKSYQLVFITIFTLGMIKEYYDSYSLTSTLLEHIKDMMVNLIYPIIRYGIYKLKKI